MRPRPGTCSVTTEALVPEPPWVSAIYPSNFGVFPPLGELRDRTGKTASITRTDTGHRNGRAADMPVGVLPQLPLRPAWRTNRVRAVFGEPQRASGEHRLRL